MKLGISEAAFKQAASVLKCEVAAIKAVDSVESRGGGFLSTGEIKILFEPHIFWKLLKEAGKTPVVSDICYPKWNTRPYGKESQQHGRLQKAVLINRDIALMSASWGRFQIMGFNYKLCGCKTIQEFINRMSKSEEEQLLLFVNYIKSVRLDDELINLDWLGFALQYNGPLYWKNNYNGKLAKAYLLFN